MPRLFGLQGTQRLSDLAQMIGRVHDDSNGSRDAVFAQPIGSIGDKLLDPIVTLTQLCLNRRPFLGRNR